MKVYVAMINDRHSDVEAEVFTTADAAIEYARNFAQRYDRWGDYEEREVKGWLFRATYSVEGDGVWVVEKELNA